MGTFRIKEREFVRKLLVSTLTVLAFLVIGLSAGAQTPTPSPTAPATSRVIGEVKAIDPAAKQIIVRLDSGVLVTVNLNDSTQYKRMALGQTTLTTATDITLTDIGAGDRVWARWRTGADQKTVPSAQIVVMSKADVAKKQEQDRAEWRRRGVSGIVAALNAETKEITVSSRTMMGAPQTVIIPVTDKVMIRRYPPDSIPKYSEARPSKFEELKTGDQLRALGDKSADGTHLTAEEVVFGSFRIAGGTVTAIDVANNQIKITDLQTKKPLTIVLRSESVLRRFPEGGMFGGGMGPGGPGGAGGTRPNAAGGNAPAQGQAKPGQGQAPGAGAQGAGPGGPGGTRPGGGGNMADLLERLPLITINDLKVGDTVIMSSLQGSDPSQLTAISLVSGVEQLLTMMASRQQTGGQAGRPQGVDLNGSFGGMFGGVGVP
jgi:co-chaperonin GroES (HSP10)